MKVLFFLTMHRQLHELEFWSYFFNNFKRLKADVCIYNTNPEFSKDTINNFLRINTNIKIICDDQNQGYQYGSYFGLSNNYDFYKNYDFIIHSHPDVFILNDEKLYELLIDQKNKDVDFLVSSGIKNQFAYLTDLFIFKPKYNFISKYINYQNHGGAETILFSIIKDNNLKKYLFSRYPNDEISGRDREIDAYNIWHEHKLENVLNYIHNTK